MIYTENCGTIGDASTKKPSGYKDLTQENSNCSSGNPRSYCVETSDVGGKNIIGDNIPQ